jgi:hypothetical protein
VSVDAVQLGWDPGLEGLRYLYCWPSLKKGMVLDHVSGVVVENREQKEKSEFLQYPIRDYRKCECLGVTEGEACRWLGLTPGKGRGSYHLPTYGQLPCLPNRMELTPTRQHIFEGAAHIFTTYVYISKIPETLQKN